MICKNCNKEFELQQKRSGGSNRVFCYDCIPFSSKKSVRDKQRRNLLVEYSNRLKLERGCDRCGYNKCARALEWHHTENNKDEEPSDAMGSSLDRYIAETNKCILLCSNCHREEHDKD